MDNNVSENKIMEDKMADNNVTEKQEKTMSPFRQVLPQFVASALANLVIFDLSLILNFSTVMIADLHHTSGPMSLDDSMASWMGSLAYMCQPVGSVCSSYTVEKFGRKGGLLLVNIPYLIAWLLMCTAPNVTFLLVANIVTGISAGLTEAPAVNFAGEMTQAHIRGTIAAAGSLFYFGGMSVGYLLGTQTDWRTAASICCAVPVIVFLMILFLPETPTYLVSKGRIKDAEKSLCWLRGWVKPSHVQRELKELIKYHDPQHRKERESNTAGVRRVLELFEPPSLRPFMLIMPFFVSSNLTGTTSIRPYMVHVFQEFKQAVDPRWATVIMSVCNVVASISLIMTVKLVGKRRMGLVFTALSGATSLLLGTYAFFLKEDSPESWIPVVLFFLLNFASTIIAQLPWMLLCEVFPFRTRGLASGVSAALLYVMLFFISNTYLGMEKTLGLHGSFWLFSAVNLLMVVYLYYTLLETEGKTLHQIERHFQQGLFLTPKHVEDVPI